ncbi:Permease of the major facilitator superfamily [Phaffia rhodozyma]|uniref:Permease of the major facilitator superfamily n=1 Tax=Phaffia rhodozyma TaxID=264483 RepID=A0A0F7SZ40_PHARH|nr:Permease of the major facilitator superfamily [Phaffia rhodozyma]
MCPHNQLAYNPDLSPSHSPSMSDSKLEKLEGTLSSVDPPPQGCCCSPPGQQSYRTKQAERKFLWKLDLCLLTWAWFSYVIKQIDASNYKTAYASGMKEDLNMGGNELNYMDTTYRVGYALMIIPSQIILTKIRPSYWLPGLEIAWGLMTGLMAACKTVNGMYALRFFIGLLEASSYPGIVCVLCCWYTPSELATRLAIFGTSYPAANIFVGFMQAALHSNMDGVGGLPGWKWLFVFNAMMTVIIASFGLLLIPDNPGETRVIWLSKLERLIAQERMSDVKKLPPTKWTLALVKKVFTSWTLYVFGLAYVGWTETQNANTWIILFLKAAKNANGTTRFSVSQLNLIPIGGYVLQIIVMVGCAWGSGRTGRKLEWIVGQMTTMLIGTIILSIWPASFETKMVGYYLLWMSNGVGPILIAWMADWCPSPEERSLQIGVIVTFVYVIDSWANVLIYPAAQAPHYRVGYRAALGFAVLCIVASFVFYFKDRELKRQAKCCDPSECGQTGCECDCRPVSADEDPSGIVEEKSCHRQQQVETKDEKEDGIEVVSAKKACCGPPASTPAIVPVSALTPQAT